ncbi:MAG: glycosyltransferase family 4 protein [Bacilli bacterium]|nr:glycosyltransferase family 4 protein [Bacilli bacterium]MDD4303654.1 glycosyltransferase family 4 protein [Bacilli bacterium]HNY74852.1 glycosyltransferase family 4 protein [Bacilli bacterium]
MKILVVCQFYYPERFTVSDICAELVSLGHDVSVVTGKPNYCYNEIIPAYRKVKYEIIDGVKVHRVNLYPRKQSRLSIIRNYLSFHRNAKAFMRRFNEQFDVVLSVSLSPVISIAPAVLYAKKHKVKHVLHCLDLWPESTVVTGAVKKDSPMYKMLFRWSRNLYLACDKIMVSSPSFADYFKEVLHIIDKPFPYVPQPSLGVHENLPPATFKKKYNFVYVGNIGTLQLIDEIAEAGKIIGTRGDVEVHLAGMGLQSENLKKYIADNSLKDIVTYYGPLPLEKAVTLYADADALIVPLKEGGTVGKTIPNKLVQYLKYGRPIIGSLSGDGRDVLVKTKGAVLADQNAESIAKAMETIIDLPADKKEEMGRQNKLYYEEHFEIRRVAQLIERELLDTKNS